MVEAVAEGMVEEVTVAAVAMVVQRALVARVVVVLRAAVAVAVSAVVAVVMARSQRVSRLLPRHPATVSKRVMLNSSPT